MQIFVCTPLTLLPIGTLSPHRPDPSRTSALLTEPGYLLLYWYIISRVFLSFMFLSFQCTGVAGACMYVEHNAIMAVLVQRSCLCRGFVTTDLYLSRMKNQRGHWVCWMSTSRKNGLMRRTYKHIASCQEVGSDSDALLSANPAGTPESDTPPHPYTKGAHRS